MYCVFMHLPGIKQKGACSNTYNLYTNVVEKLIALAPEYFILSLVYVPLYSFFQDRTGANILKYQLPNIGYKMLDIKYQILDIKF